MVERCVRPSPTQQTYITLQPKRTQQDIIYTIYISFFCWDKTLLQNLFLTGERLGERVNRATGGVAGKKRSIQHISVIER